MDSEGGAGSSESRGSHPTLADAVAGGDNCTMPVAYTDHVARGTGRDAAAGGGRRVTVCRGAVLVTLRIAWAVVVVLALAPSVASFAELTARPSLSVLLESGIFAFDPGLARSLAEVGFGRDLLLHFDLGFRAVGMAVFSITAMVIFVRKSDDWMTGLASAMLLLVGAAWFAPFGALEPGSVVDAMADITGANRPFTVEFGGTLAGAAMILFLTLFPDGRFVPRWSRYLAVLGAAAPPLWAITQGSPLHPPSWPEPAQHTLVAAVLGGALYAQAYRYLAVSDATRRQQTKLVLAALAIITACPLLLLLTASGLSSGVGGLAVVTPRVEAVYNLMLLSILGAALLLLPLSIAVSVLRYRLWDIDLFINRTIAYGAVTAVLGAAYFGVVAAVGAVASGSTVTVATATLTVALLFQPVRTRIQDVLDRRFDRQRYDAARALEAFAARLRREIDLESLARELLRVVEETMRPTGVSLWIPQVTEAGAAATDRMERVAFRVAGAERVRGADFADIDLHTGDVDALSSSSGPIDLDALAEPPKALEALRAVKVKLVVPLVGQGEVIGMLNLGPRLSESDYSSGDLRLLAMLADHAAAALRVALLVKEHESEMRARERIDNEMRVARLIQQSFLPRTLPRLEGWEVFAQYLPARDVGGDLYDLTTLPDGRLLVVAGDVSGKGVPAALVMATTRTLIRSEATRAAGPGELLSAVNEQLYLDTPAAVFVTCMCAIIDPATGRIVIANAGHNIPYVRMPSDVAELKATGMPLGLMPGSRYDERTAELPAGSCLVIHSDGLAEAHGAGGEMFGFERVRRLVAACRDPARMIETLLVALASFTGPSWEQEDDITLLVLHRRGLGAGRAPGVTTSEVEPAAETGRRPEPDRPPLVAGGDS